MLAFRLFKKLYVMLPLFHIRLAICIGLLLTTLFHLEMVIADDLLDEPVETLDTIEVPATFVIREERIISIPFPTMSDLIPFSSKTLGPVDPFHRDSPKKEMTKVARDSIADIQGIRKPVRPTKAERPPYPQFAREQGWEGTVVLRIRVNQGGSVDLVKTQKSSGFPILDESAVQSVKSWKFEPAKDGEFSISSTVDLPIRFDLDEQ